MITVSTPPRVDTDVDAGLVSEDDFPCALPADALETTRPPSVGTFEHFFGTNKQFFFWRAFYNRAAPTRCVFSSSPGLRPRPQPTAVQSRAKDVS